MPRSPAPRWLRQAGPVRKTTPAAGAPRQPLFVATRWSVAVVFTVLVLGAWQLLRDTVAFPNVEEVVHPVDDMTSEFEFAAPADADIQPPPATTADRAHGRRRSHAEVCGLQRREG